MMFGLVYTLMILSSWFVGFFYRWRRRNYSEFKDKCPRCNWQNITQVDVEDSLQKFKCAHCSKSWYVRKTFQY